MTTTVSTTSEVLRDLLRLLVRDASNKGRWTLERELEVLLRQLKVGP